MLKSQIIAKLGSEEVDFEEYENLILDEMPVGQFTDEDKNFLEQFTECRSLSLNSCQLTTLQNFPFMKKLVKLEICDNLLTDVPKTLGESLASLKTLKMRGNKIESLEGLRCLTLKSLELSTDDEARVWSDLRCEVVNGHDKDGNSVQSSDSESCSGYGSEEGEHECDEEDLESEVSEQSASAEIKETTAEESKPPREVKPMIPMDLPPFAPKR